MYELVIRALQKSRINGDDRLVTFARETRGERERVLLAMPTSK
jgi:hypothetical protein